MCMIMTSYPVSAGLQIWIMCRQAPGGSNGVMAQVLGLGGSDVVMAQVLGLGDMRYGAGPGEVSIWLMMEMS